MKSLSFGSITVTSILIFTVSEAFHQYREVVCLTPDHKLRGGKEKAKCHLVIKEEELDRGRDAPQGSGCFTENKNGVSREYCDLVCPNAHTVFPAYLNVGHRSCFNYFSYELEQRGNEWFLWRGGECANSTVTFRIGCKFDDPFTTQFKNDNEVFAKLRARARART